MNTERDPSTDQASDENLPCQQCHNIFKHPQTLQRLRCWPGLVVSRNEGDLLRAAIAGCRLCRELLQMPTYLQAGVVKLIKREAFDTRTNWPIENWKVRLQNLAGDGPSMDFLWRGMFESLGTLRSLEVSRNQQAVFFEVALPFGMLKKRLHGVSNADSLALLLVGHFPTSLTAKHVPNGDMLCRSTYEAVRLWLKSCEASHILCRRIVSGTPHQDGLPARVLDVISLRKSGQKAVNLVTVMTNHLKYAALSYCWGAAQPHSTRSSNLDEYMRCIPVSTLPKTLQDAIVVTRKLHLRYLWIDSLCIIQDSDSDKEQELARMGTIYHHAYITISAASASNCTQGFVRQQAFRDTYVFLPFRVDEKSVNRIAMGPIKHSDNWTLSPMPEPIHERAWTFQEGFMARRLLIYSEHQIFWHCVDRWGKEGGNMTRDVYYLAAGTKDMIEDEKGFNPSYQALRSPTVADWKRIVKMYSLKKMGDPLDKLPAISSVASYFADRTNDTYLAGLWSNSFRELLLWHRGKSASRSGCWRAPSWSFFSIDGHIHFPTKSVRFNDDSNRAIPTAASVISCEALPVSKIVPFGRISSAELVISGRLLQVELSESLPAAHPMNLTEDGHASLVNMRAYVRPVGSLHDLGYVLMDTLVEDADQASDNEVPNTILKSNQEDWTWSQDLWFFMLGVMDSEKEADISGLGPSNTDEWLPIGLALAKLPNGIFQRIGFAQSDMFGKGIEVFQQLQPQVIIIV